MAQAKRVRLQILTLPLSSQEVAPSAGALSADPRLRIGYFSQYQIADANLDLTAVEYLLQTSGESRSLFPSLLSPPKPLPPLQATFTPQPSSKQLLRDLFAHITLPPRLNPRSSAFLLLTLLTVIDPTLPHTASRRRW